MTQDVPDEVRDAAGALDTPRGDVPVLDDAPVVAALESLTPRLASALREVVNANGVNLSVMWGDGSDAHPRGSYFFPRKWLGTMQVRGLRRRGLVVEWRVTVHDQETGRQVATIWRCQPTALGRRVSKRLAQFRAWDDRKAAAGNRKRRGDIGKSGDSST